MSANRELDRPSPLPRLLALLWLPLVAWCLYQGWGRWSDPQIDFGRELYVPWRLSQGDWLYRDIAYFNGPLSPSFNALLFKLFGTGYWTLVAGNAVLLAGFCALLWRTLRDALPAAVDSLAILSFLLFASVAFFFGQQLLCGNYNFLSPYSHEATHGLMLGFAALACAGRGALGRGRAFLIGLLLGLVFLTKVELFVATAAGLTYLLLRASERNQMARLLPSIFGGVLLPGALALVCLSSQMPLGLATRGVLGGWPHLLAGEASQLAFYQAILGFDAPLSNALAVLRATGILLALLGLGSLLACRVRSLPAAAGIFVLSFFGWRAASGVLAPVDWLARSLPLASCLILVSSLFLRSRVEGLGAQKAWSLFQALVLFGLVLLGKMILQPRFMHYGFFLTLPASAALFLFSLGWLPRLLGAPRAYLAACVLGAYGAAGTSLLGTSDDFFGIQTLPLAQGVDGTKTDFRGRELSAALGVLKERLNSDDELLILPEGIGLNYLARRPTPTRFINFMPLELLLFGEEVILDELHKNPPRVVLLMHKDTSEYGFPYFGRDYGQQILDWVLANYEPIWSESRGGAPLQPGTIFGASLYELRSP